MFYMKRDRGYLRRERAKHIKRRKRISKHYWYVEHDGYLDKGKIHCSCPLCRGKEWSVGDNSIKQLTITDRRKMNRMESQMNEIDEEE